MNHESLHLSETTLESKNTSYVILAFNVEYS